MVTTWESQPNVIAKRLSISSAVAISTDITHSTDRNYPVGFLYGFQLSLRDS